MALQLYLRPTAQQDAENAQDWYDNAAPGLGEAFTREFLAALVLLAEQPGIGSRRFSYLYPRHDIRTWSMDRFPFRIFYAVEDDTLTVYRLWHERRRVTKSILQ